MEDFILFTAPDCEWCDKAKEALRKRNLTFVEFLTTDVMIRQFMFALNVKSVPQIFTSAHGNTSPGYIGGFNELEHYLHTFID